MGMFDTVIMEYPLPDPEVQDEDFQTKNLQCLMLDYVVTIEGRLLESVSDDEREPRWLDTDYHGDLYIYTSTGVFDAGTFRWYEYLLRFTHGQLESLQQAEQGAHLWNAGHSQK